jgi:hypothetical protein
MTDSVEAIALSFMLFRPFAYFYHAECDEAWGNDDMQREPRAKEYSFAHALAIQCVTVSVASLLLPLALVLIFAVFVRLTLKVLMVNVCSSVPY